MGEIAFEDLDGLLMAKPSPGGELSAVTHGVDGFPLADQDPLLEAHRTVDALLANHSPRTRRGPAPRGRQPEVKLEAQQHTLLDVPGRPRLQLLKALLIRALYNPPTGGEQYQYHRLCCQLVEQLLAKHRPVFAAGEDLADVTALLGRHDNRLAELDSPAVANALLEAAASALDRGVDDGLMLALDAWSKRGGGLTAANQRTLQALLERWPEPTYIPTLADDDWGVAVMAHWRALDAQDQKHWQTLWELCRHSGNAAKASQTFLRRANAAVDGLGRTVVGHTVGCWVDLAATLKPQPVFAEWGYLQGYRLLCPYNQNLLRALLWLVPQLPLADGPVRLAALTRAAHGKIKGYGAPGIRLGNTCLGVLAELGNEGVAQLMVLRRQLKTPQVLKQIDKCIDQAAQQRGVDRQVVEDLATPHHDLVDGQRQVGLGEHQARLAIEADGRGKLSFWTHDGKALKSAPAAVKRDYPADLKALKGAEKALQGTLSDQKARLEGFYLQNRHLSAGHWRRHLLNHGLLGVLVKRLIWRLGSGDNHRDILWYDGAWRDATGNAVAIPDDDTPMGLWHPLYASVEAGQRWRQVLGDFEIRQPFKQAHREVYLLTDAEERTATHSHRFAAHILRQHQFDALAKGRGWRYRLMGGFDGDYFQPQLTLPAFDLVAEFWVDVPPHSGQSEAGIFLYLTSDRVQFYTPDDATPLPLAAIPPLVFSEVMRDVDLFVGVASIGNDPQWQPQDDQPQFEDYWHDYAFGELSAMAKTRREVLGALLPQLKIAPRCRLEGRFLHVEGTLQRYKIHLGSSNILMEPGERYLCIVQGADSKAAGVFLPFEGDRTLGLILSKAFLLAEDHKIKDPSIVSQWQPTR